VTRSTLCCSTSTDELDSIDVNQLRTLCATLLSEREALRLPGTDAHSWPRDRFNPFTHSPSETVSHQRKNANLMRFRIPYLVSVLSWKLLQTHGLESEGIFRVSPESHTTDELRRFIVTENWTEVTSQTNPHVYAAMLKHYFVTLSTPLFPDARAVLALGRAGMNCDWNAIVSELLHTMSQSNLHLLWWWVSLCRLIALYEHVSCMGLRQLVTCWAPCLVRLELELSTMTQDTEALTMFLMCILQNHPVHHPLGEALIGMRCTVDGEPVTIQSFSFKSQLFTLSNDDFVSFDELSLDHTLNNDYCPIAVTDFFAPFLQARPDNAAEDFFDLERNVGRLLFVGPAGSSATPEVARIANWLRILDAIPYAELSESFDSLFPYIWKRGVFFPLFKALVEREVEQTKHLNSLFRQNSRATKLLKSMLTVEGAKFLKTVIAPFVRDLCRQNTDMNVGPTNSDEENKQRIFALSEGLYQMCSF
jgi:hypothetical protein